MSRPPFSVISAKAPDHEILLRLLGDSLVLPLESFVRVDSVIDGNFDDISLVDFDLVTKALTALRAGREAEIPQVCSLFCRVCGYFSIYTILCCR